MSLNTAANVFLFGPYFFRGMSLIYCLQGPHSGRLNRRLLKLQPRSESTGGGGIGKRTCILLSSVSGKDGTSMGNDNRITIIVLAIQHDRTHHNGTVTWAPWLSSDVRRWADASDDHCGSEQT